MILSGYAQANDYRYSNTTKARGENAIICSRQ